MNQKKNNGFCQHFSLGAEVSLFLGKKQDAHSELGPGQRGRAGTGKVMVPKASSKEPGPPVYVKVKDEASNL